MADLETAASEAVERVQRLVAELDLANEALDQAETDTERLRGEVGAAVEEFERAATELSSRLVSETESTHAEAEQTREQLDGLRSEVDAAAGSLQAARQGLLETFANARERVVAADGEHAQALAELDAVVESLRQRAADVEARLGAIGSEVDSFLGQELPQAFDDAERQVNEARSRAHAAVETAAERIQAEGREFAETVAQFRQDLAEAFEAAPATVSGAVEQATAAYTEAHQALLTGLEEKGRWVLETLEAAERAAVENDFDDIARQAQADSQAVLDGLRRIVSAYRAATEHCAQYELEGAQQALSQLPA